MKTEIITIGDELLIGQVVDTNSAWMAKELNKIGFDVYRITTIGDEREELLEAFETAIKRVDVVLVTGGIGPTKDDITKKTLCEYFDTDLVFDESVLGNIEALFAHRNIPVNELTQSQAYVPRACSVIQNTAGTAPITWFEKDGKVLVSMPGVPYEMKTAMSNEVLPRLQEKFTPEVHILHRTYSVKGYSESALAMHLAGWENALPAYFKLAYLPQPGIVRLRLTGRNHDLNAMKAEADQLEIKLKELLEDAIYDSSDAPIGEFIGELLKKHNLTFATAESCTGGFIAHLITSVSGSSSYYQGGVVSYANEVKEQVLGVSAETLKEFGAVSEPVAVQMVEGVARITGADVAVATTGVAGPGGGTPEKPVGTVCIAVKVKDEVRVERFRFGAQRELNIQRSANAALFMAAEMIQMQR